MGYEEDNFSCPRFAQHIAWLEKKRRSESLQSVPDKCLLKSRKYEPYHHSHFLNMFPSRVRFHWAVSHIAWSTG